MLVDMKVIAKNSFRLVGLIALLLTPLLIGCATSEVRKNRAEFRAYAKEIDLNNLNAEEQQFLEDYKDREFSEDELEFIQKSIGDRDPKSLTDAEMIVILHAAQSIIYSMP